MQLSICSPTYIAHIWNCRPSFSVRVPFGKGIPILHDYKATVYRCFRQFSRYIVQNWNSCAEHVSYHHMAVGFVRGKWRNRERRHSSMLMAKCCHDLDLIMWMKSGVPPVRVASFGNNMQFRPEKAPGGSGTNCLIDCPIERDCLYSARKHYLDHPKRWAFYVSDALEELERPTHADREGLLRSDSPYGRCVWKSDNDVVDHQSVVIPRNRSEREAEET